MTGEDGRSPEPRDVDAEFARMLRDEGLALGPGRAPREPAAPEDEHGPGRFAAEEDEDGPPTEEALQESRRRAREAHPSRGPRDAPPRELDDDEVLYGDFEQPDPDLPTPSDAAMWAWTALLGGFVLMLVVALTPTLPGVLGWLGGLAALGGMVALLLRAPRRRRDDGDDGAEV